jgi:NADH:ubiquinone oxidoreductase subunit H
MASQFTRSQVPIRQMGDAMRQTSSLINYTMIMPLAMLGGAAIQASRNFEKSMKKIQGLVGLSAKEVQSFSKDILGMAANTARAPLELADAMYYISRRRVSQTA